MQHTTDEIKFNSLNESSIDTLLTANVLGTCEAELKDGITATFAPMPQAEQQQDNSVYNLNALLDALD